MTIKGLNDLKKKHAPNANLKISMKQFSGKRIAIDANLWMKKNMSVVRTKIIDKTDLRNNEPNEHEIRREWFLAVINFIKKWLSNNTTPIFVFDGKPRKEKENTVSSRKQDQEAIKYKIDAFYKMVKDQNSPVSIVDDLRKALKSYNPISYDDRELFKMILRGIGIPCLQALHDAEQLCSSLCIDGKVAAVYSDDTDNYAFGCPLLITGFSNTYTYDEYNNVVSDVDCVRLDKFLEGLNITHNVFVDLCIMCGCDYNTNMPGYAAIKSYNLLQKYGSIDALPRNFDTTCLDHNNCRNIFKYVPYQEFISDDDKEISLNINIDTLDTCRDYLDIVGISSQVKVIVDAYTTLIAPTDGLSDMFNAMKINKYKPNNIIRLKINKQETEKYLLSMKST
jgi:flap endonuclease-1